ncbi:MAG: HAMP domain-containing sensor histidine kinase [Clostridiales bacterium]|uniref:sensor histidine kinase n=2 Tax=Bacillota TaxID=1239 RepID=UPI001BAF8F32|nr:MULTISPECIES: HAMP domain-containing sensor histidine kinase [Bacillota]MDD7592580.1 HAMP domain-containing sensor histidine kinase [Bacilli bacterium]MDD7753565.1 HAMP domain-containing sensor histidine kinase [Clostridiales bacterium]MDY5832880.1 HAMP domain-containing sensor histidine kinase [Candidatus Onthovivens sp.]MBS3202645.1 HAMP domain-containing histidine kinase [Turicibacter bilis]MDY4134423.1 HAMP domain-containing sensor histidine kinase [Terrisporobacter sp.]
MAIVIIFLISIIIVLLLRLLFVNKEIKNIVRQLEDYNNFKTRKKIDINLINKNIEGLAQSINKHIEISKKLQIKQLNSEEELKSMISSISHDLRTPLTSIRGYLQMLKKTDISDAKRDKYLAIADNRAKDLQELINQFFMFSVIEDSKYNMQLESVDLKEVFIEILTSFYDEFTSKNIEPIIEICDSEISVLGDYASIKRVIENLMINISKHSKGNVKITINITNNYAELIVIDYIYNNSDIQIERLFDKFYKADKARKVNSTGLGLFIVKKLMLKMNGNVEALLQDNKLFIKCRWTLS